MTMMTTTTMLMKMMEISSYSSSFIRPYIFIIFIIIFITVFIIVVPMGVIAA